MHWPFEMMVDFFLNQVTIKQLISHKNVMRPYGCYLETEIPMLVFELISNGTLFDHLHGHCNETPCWISWLDHVRIATETSYALCYLHYGRPRPIVHLNVKSSNIFLNESWTVKLLDFGFSVSIALGEDFFQSSSIEGTTGYIDPEYLEKLHVREKFDVYGFGVVLVEVLIGDYPTETFLGHMNLVRLLCFVNGREMHITKF